MGVAVENIFEEYLSKRPIFSNKDILSIKYKPDNIPHREEQISTVAKILAPCLRKENPSNIFIYGKTGTGKSLSANYVCKQLSNISEKKDIPLKIIYLNCKMGKVADTEYRLIAQLSREFGKEVPATGLPTSEVYKIFYELIDEKEVITLLVLDEIDRLLDKCGDEVLYNLTRINQELENAKLNIIGISNDVTFINNLDPRVRSSLNEEEVVFPPYDALQIKDILKERAEDAFNNGVVSESVISKCAAYAAREHGDARRALDLLRVAGELAERTGKDKIEEEDVDLAEEKIEKESIEEVIEKLPKQSQAVLYAALLLLKNRENKEPVYTGEIYDVYKSVCIRTSSKPLTQRRVSDLIAELDMLGIINAKVISKGRYGRTREILLCMSKEILENVNKMLKSNLGL